MHPLNEQGEPIIAPDASQLDKMVILQSYRKLISTVIIVII